jgi:hypothetical protein
MVSFTMTGIGVAEIGWRNSVSLNARPDTSGILSRSKYPGVIELSTTVFRVNSVVPSIRMAIVPAFVHNGPGYEIATFRKPSRFSASKVSDTMRVAFGRSYPIYSGRSESSKT